jgi:hypothetical protein
MERTRFLRHFGGQEEAEVGPSIISPLSGPPTVFGLVFLDSLRIDNGEGSGWPVHRRSEDGLGRIVT